MVTVTTLAFLRELKGCNTREWFEGHKKEYLASYADFLDMVVQLIAELAAFDEDIAASRLDPKSCIMRINRDVRFSRDKSPYKTNFFAYINKGGRKSPFGGYYLHVEPGASFAGGGVYMPESAVLEQLRQEISLHFEEWQSLVQGDDLLRFFPEGVQASGSTKRPPRGYDGSDPAIAYLRYKGYFTQRFFSDDEVADSGFTRQLADSYRSVKPLIDFLNRAIK